MVALSQVAAAPTQPVGTLQSAVKVLPVADPSWAMVTSRTLQLGDASSATEHAPSVFERLRRMSGIHHASFVTALSSTGSLTEFKSNSLGSQSKGLRLFWADRRRFMVKEITHQDLLTLLVILDDYGAYLEAHPNSLLNRLLGLYSVSCPSASSWPWRKRTTTTHYLILDNVFWGHTNMRLLFDLKGSLVGRTAFKGGIRTSRDRRSGVVRKDLDFLALQPPLRLGPIPSRRLSLALERDLEFLASHNLMDYSLLVGVVRSSMPKWARSTVRLFSALALAPCSSFRSTKGEVLRCGVIDFTQRYTLKKRLETMMKSLLYDRSKISCVNPVLYAARFLEFMTMHLLDCPLHAPPA